MLEGLRLFVCFRRNVNMTFPKRIIAIAIATLITISATPGNVQASPLHKIETRTQITQVDTGTSKNARVLSQEIKEDKARARRIEARRVAQREAREARQQEASWTSRSTYRAPSSGLNWAALRQCEVNYLGYTANTGNGYYGAYQFSLSTWQAQGGSGLPSDASPAEQDMRAQMLYDEAGSSPWPVCGSLL